jgi:hypothetical protein
MNIDNVMTRLKEIYVHFPKSYNALSNGIQ